MIQYRNVSFGGPLGLITTIILTQYFNNTGPCSLELYDHIGIMEYKSSLCDFPRMVLSEKQLNFKSIERCQNILISTVNPLKTFAIMEDYIKYDTEIRYNNRRYFIVFQNKLPQCNKSLKNNSCELLNMLKYVLDILIIQCDNFSEDEVDKDSKCTFFTYIIRDNTRIDWMYLDSWFWYNESFLQNRNLYPNRIADVDNIFGTEFRVLNAGGIDYQPYSYIEPSMGMELTAIIEYSRKHNFLLNIINDEQGWGQIFPNWTGSGVLGGVISDKYDIGFSALFPLPLRIIYADFSTPTAYSCVSCIVPAPRKVYSWLTPVKGLTFLMWIYIIASLLAVALALRIIKIYMKNFDESLKNIYPLTTFSLSLIQPLPSSQLPTKFSLRLLYITVLIFALLTTTIYNSRLSSLLVIPSYEDEIRTVNDLAVSNLLWGEKAIDWALPLAEDKRPIYETVYSNFRVVTDEITLREYSTGNNFAFGMERLITGYYAVGSYLDEDIINDYRAMKFDLYRQYTALQLRKSSVLLPSIDLFLMQAWEYGLLYFWEDEINIYYMNYKVQQSLKNPPKHDTTVRLQVDHIIGLFLIWGIGIVLSTFIFILEMYLSEREAKNFKKILRL